MPRPRLSSSLILAALLAGQFAANAPAAAGEDPRVVLMRFPLGNRIPNNGWSPVFVRIENPRNTAVEVGAFTTFDMGGTGTQVSFLRRFLPEFMVDRALRKVNGMPV